MFVRLLLSLCLVLSLPAAYAEDAAPPDGVVKDLVDDVLASIRKDREITHDLNRMEGLVERRILPSIDFLRMTRQAVGTRYWGEATPEQQARLVDEFRTLLAHTFSRALTHYTDQTVMFTPFHAQPGAQEATVKSVIVDPRDEATMLDYRLEKTETGWLIYDMKIDNFSLIRIYRSNFGGELQQGGVSGLIGVLHKKNQSPDLSGHG